MNITDTNDLNNPTPEITEGIRQWEIAVYNSISGRFLADNHFLSSIDKISKITQLIIFIKFYTIRR